MVTEQQAGRKRGSLIGWVIIGLFALATAWVVYASGRSSSVPQVTATATPFVVIVRVTITPTPSQPPTLAPTHTARPSRTPALTRTETPTETPYVTPTRAPAESVRLANAHLALHAPNSDTLFEVIKLTLAESVEVNPDDDGAAVQNAISWSEVAAIHSLTAADSARHYGGGLPSAGSVLTSTLEVHYGWVPYSLMQLLRAAAIRFVLDHPTDILRDEHGYTLGMVDLAAQSLEMDGDAGREWLVAVTFTHYYVKDWLVFDEDANGQPKLLPAPWPPYYDGHDPVELDATHDFTGDGRAEIVLVAHHYMWGRDWAEAFIYHWRGSGWQLVGSPGLPSGPIGWDITSEYTLEDVNADGRTDMRVTTPEWLGFNCRYDIVTDYAWNGSAVVVVNEAAPLPDLSGCTIAAAQRAADPADQIAGFERALAQAQTEGAKPDAVAWIRVQLAMRLAGQWRGDEATAMLQAAVETEGDGGYLTMLRQAVAEFGLKPLPICDALNRQAQGVQGSLGTDIDEDIAYPGYPMTYEPSPEAVCPLSLLTTELLEHAVLPADQSPALAMEAAGFALGLIEPLALDADPEPEWVGVMAVGYRYLLVFDQEGEVWAISVTSAFANAATMLATYAKPGAPTQDLLAVTALANDAGWNCDTGLAPLDVGRLSRLTEGWRTTGWKTRCADPALLDLTDPAHRDQVVALLDAPEPVSETAEPLPAWMRLEGYDGNAPAGLSLLEYIDQLQADTLARRRPLGTQQEITALLGYLPAGDTAAERVATRLYYLSGLGYELAGDERAALAAYATVLVRAPSSTWAWLAWARVGPE